MEGVLSLCGAVFFAASKKYLSSSSDKGVVRGILKRGAGFSRDWPEIFGTNSSFMSGAPSDKARGKMASVSARG